MDAENLKNMLKAISEYQDAKTVWELIEGDRKQNEQNPYYQGSLDEDPAPSWSVGGCK